MRHRHHIRLAHNLASTTSRVHSRPTSLRAPNKAVLTGTRFDLHSMLKTPLSETGQHDTLYPAAPTVLAALWGRWFQEGRVLTRQTRRHHSNQHNTQPNVTAVS